MRRCVKSTVARALLVGLVCFVWASTVATALRAADEAVAAAGPPLNIAIFVNSSPTRCYSSGHVLATHKLATLAADRINAHGGVRGRPIRLNFYDNKNKWEQTAENARAAVQLDGLIAMIGFTNQSNAPRVFETIADLKATDANDRTIPTSNIPIIANVEKTWAAEHHRNVFSTHVNQEAERVPAMVKFFEATNKKRIAFFGRTNAPWAATVGRLLREQVAGLKDDPDTPGVIDIVSDHRIDIEHKTLSAVQLSAAIGDLKKKNVDMLVLSVGTGYTPQVLKVLQANAIKDLPIFLVGWLHKGLYDPRNPYPAPIYGIDWAEVPEVENDRLFNILGEGSPDEWLFADREVVSGGVWNERGCNKQFRDYVPSTYSTRNIAAAKFGALYADMVKLVATSAAKTGETLDIGLSRDGKTTPIERYRLAILNDLEKTYVTGRGAFKGLFENWYFRPSEHVRSLTPLIVILPHTIGRKQLAPTQIIRLPNRKLKPIETLYIDLDLTRIYSVDNNRKSFYAEFYLAMRHNPNFGFEDITFANAFLDPRSNRDRMTNGRELSVDVLYGGGESDAYPADMRLFKVAGRFRFHPDFSEYPFDRQQFSIDIQPRNSDKTFIVQPPPLSLRDKTSASEGWIPKKQYVSYVEDFVPVVNAFTHNQSVVPFYNTRYVWQMERETTDYYIRVVVPLIFILIVAYLSIFIPRSHLDSIVTIQITALLAAVALYLSLPEIDTDTATISDRIFMFNYMMVSIMIIVSILRINTQVSRNAWLNHALQLIHIILVPLIFIGLVLYITKSEIVRGFTELPGWRLLGIG